MPEIHELNQSTTLTGAEIFPLSQELLAKRATLNAIKNFILSPVLDITSFTGGILNEKGSVVSNITLNWTYNLPITSQEMSTFGVGIIGPTLRTLTLTGLSITTNTAFNLSATDDNTTVTATTTTTFGYKRYYGASSLATLTDSQIKALTNDLSAQSRVQSRQIVCDNEYIYLAWPDTWGGSTASSFTVNGLLNTAWTKVRSNSFTNDSGDTFNIAVFRSNNLLTGTFNIGVV
jgi:hypothetical protein